MRFLQRISWNHFTLLCAFKSTDNFITGSWVLWGAPYFTSLRTFYIVIFLKLVNILYWLSSLAISLQTLLIKWLPQYPWASLSYVYKTKNHFLKHTSPAGCCPILSFLLSPHGVKELFPVCRFTHCNLASAPSTALLKVLNNLLVATFNEHPSVLSTDSCSNWLIACCLQETVLQIPCSLGSLPTSLAALSLASFCIAHLLPTL